MPCPRAVAHADWSANAPKRWVAVARLDGGGQYRADGPFRVRPDTDLPLLERLHVEPTASALLGFDFPIGLPEAYAARAGVTSFKAVLAEFGRNEPWLAFLDPARDAKEISVHRPFYPAACREKGTRSMGQLTKALELSPSKLYRRCDRPPACAMFWTLGGNQVGKGALTGWKEILQSELLRNGVRLWPFDGDLADLVADEGIVIAETYPRAFYAQLDVKFGSAKGTGKQSQGARADNAAALHAFAGHIGVSLTDQLARAIHSGFGPSKSGEDPFDAVVGLLGMLGVVAGELPSALPDDPAARASVCSVEGWMLGQQPEATSPRGSST